MFSSSAASAQSATTLLLFVATICKDNNISHPKPPLHKSCRQPSNHGPVLPSTFQFPLACCPPPPLPPVICCIKSHANWSPGPSAVIFLDHGLHEAIDWREETPDELIDYGKIPEFKPVVTYADVPGMGHGLSPCAPGRGVG